MAKLLEIKTSYDSIRKVLTEIMVEGIDYEIDGRMAQRILSMSGAEKIATLRDFNAEYICTNRVIRDDLIVYEYSCKLFESGNPVGQWEGSCNSKEEHYRYKISELTPDQISDKAYLKKLADRNQLTITSNGNEINYFEREERRDYYEHLNAIMIKAQERSFIGVVLNVTGLSDIFRMEANLNHTNKIPNLPHAP